MTAAKNRGIRRERTTFEWTLLLVSVAAALTLAIALAISGVTGASGPADLEIDVAASAPASGGRPLEITVTNVGGTSAENVVVEVTVGDISREVTLELVAKGDEESATIVVPTSASGTPQAEVLSYSDPQVATRDDRKSGRLVFTFGKYRPLAISGAGERIVDFVESERLKLGSGTIVWMKDVIADAQDLNDLLRESSDMHMPRFILESASGTRNEVPLVRQTRSSLATELQAWLTPEEAQTVIDRFGVGFHVELEGQVIATFYALRN